MRAAAASETTGGRRFVFGGRGPRGPRAPARPGRTAGWTPRLAAAYTRRARVGAAPPARHRDGIARSHALV